MAGTEVAWIAGKPFLVAEIGVKAWVLKDITSLDLPARSRRGASVSGSPAHAGIHHAKGQLFEYTIDLSVQKTRNSKPKAQRKSKPNPQKSPPKPRAAKQLKPKRETPPVKQRVPMSPEDRLQHRRAYEQKRSQTPERKELNRRTALAKRQEAKRLGLCVGCGAPPIPDETRCETCAENHRVNRRQSQKNAKQKAAQREIQESDQTTFL